MLKRITRNEFKERYPDDMIYGLDHHDPIYLEGGVILINDEWNGEFYIIRTWDDNGNVDERRYRPVYEPIDWDDDGEVSQVEIIGCEEC